jgi:hypothetical protein
MSYTYLIGWSKHNIWYYGVRYAKNCHPDDLWKTYFTSSKYVKSFRISHGEPDIIKVRKIFINEKNAIKCEDRVIRTLKLYQKDNFLNKSYSGSIYYDEEVRKKISDSRKGKKSPHLKNKSKEHIEKMRKTKTGVKQTEEHIKSVSESLKKKWADEPHHCLGTKLSEDHKNKISNGLKNSFKFQFAKENNNFANFGKNNGMYGKKHSEETKQKIRLKALERNKNNG